MVPFPVHRARNRREPDRPAASPPVEDVGIYESAGRETRADYVHRMLVNAAGLAISGLLVLSGVWIANKMADVRRVQDCALSGRRNCAPITFEDSALLKNGR